MQKPNLIIAGCQKSGTTWLHASLSKSSQIFGSKIKELNHFNKPDFQVRQPEYEKNFPDTPGARYYMEATPHYFQLPNRYTDIAMNIRTTLPEAKIVLIFRDPVSRYESAYIHHMMMGRIPYKETINTVSDDFKMLTLGKYADILKHWQGVFPEISLNLYDDLKANEGGLIENIMKFLELENDITLDDLKFRTNDKHQKAQRARENWDVMPQLSKETYLELAEFYHDQVRELETMLGRDLGHWGQRFART